MESKLKGKLVIQIVSGIGFSYIEYKYLIIGENIMPIDIDAFDDAVERMIAEKCEDIDTELYAEEIEWIRNRELP